MGRTASLQRTAKLLAALVALVALCLACPVQAQEAEWKRLRQEVSKLYDQGNYGQGVIIAKQALAVAEGTFGPDHPDVATSLNDLANLYRAQGQYAQAEPLFKRSLALRENALGPDHPDVATSLNGLANLYWRQGLYAQAELLFKRSLALRENALGPDHPDVATSLNDLANLYRRQGLHAQAEPLFNRALAIREKALGPEHPDVAGSLNDLANMYRTQGQHAQAEPLLKRSLAIHEKALGPEHPDVADSLHSLAALYRDQGQYAQAEPLSKRSLDIYEKALGPEHPSVAASLNDLALLYLAQGQHARAEPLFKRSLAVRENALGPEHPGLGTTLSNLALLYRDQGQYAQAEQLFKRSLTIREKALGPEHPDVATSLNNLALLYWTQGQHAQAEPLYKRSLAIHEKAFGPENPNVVAPLHNLAALYLDQGQYAQAEPLYKRALAVFEKALGPQHPLVATSLNALALLYRTQGRHAQAEPLFKRSLAVRENALGPEHPDVAYSLNNLAVLYGKQELHAQAEPLLLRALRIADSAGLPPLQATVYASLAKHYQATGQVDLAVLFGKRAVNILQSLRSINVGLDEEAKRSLLKKNESVYTSLADLLISQGRLPEAQQVVTMLKEEEYFDFVRRSGKDDPRSTRIGFNSREAAWQASLDSVTAPLATLGRERAALLRLRKAGLSPKDEMRLAELEDQFKVARKRYDDATAQIVADARRQAGDQAMRTGAEAIDSLRAWRGTLKELGEGTVLLTYVIAPERLWIILTTADVQVARKSDIKAAELNKLVFDFRRVLSAPSLRDARSAGQALHKHMIGPVAEELDAANARTLMVSLDGSLRYVPVSALHDGKRYLAERYGTAMLTEAAKTQVSKKSIADWTIAGMGLTQSVPGFDALPGVREELEGLVRKDASGQGILPGEVYLDERFTAKQLQAVLGAQDRSVLHVASHFHFTTGADAESFLVLGDGSKLTLREIRDSDLRFDHVDLLTLSACETAVGNNAQGREVEGLGALAQKQGAKAVVATLWPVADTSTGTFMRHLYKLRNDGKLSKAEALRQAQLEFLRPDSAYQHPIFWAPFILMGNWL